MSVSRLLLIIQISEKWRRRCWYSLVLSQPSGAAHGGKNRLVCVRASSLRVTWVPSPAPPPTFTLLSGEPVPATPHSPRGDARPGGLTQETPDSTNIQTGAGPGAPGRRPAGRATTVNWMTVCIVCSVGKRGLLEQQP